MTPNEGIVGDIESLKKRVEALEVDIALLKALQTVKPHMPSYPNYEPWVLPNDHTRTTPWWEYPVTVTYC